MDDTSAETRTEGIAAALASHTDVGFAYLFGSAARGTARADSDLDVAVFFGTGAGRGRADAEAAGGRLHRARRALELEGELERAAGRPVQVVALDDAPLGLVHNVLRSGELVLSRDEEAHRRFFVSHARRYYDMEPARRIFERYRKRRIQEGTFGGRSRNGT